MKKWFKRWQWKLERFWYQFRIWLGWWYCEYCEKMHSPFIAKYDFQEDQTLECSFAVYEVPVPKHYEYDPAYFYEITKKTHKVG